MRNLLAFVALIVITFFGLGWYLDWYRIRHVPTESGRSSFQIEIDRTKIGEDSRRFIKQGGDKIQEALEERSKEVHTDSRARTNPGLEPGEVEEAEPPAKDSTSKPR